MACYISQDFLPRFTVIASFSPETDDFMMLDVSTPQGCWGTNSPRLTISNAYARPLPPSLHRVSPESSLLDLDHQYLVAGVTASWVVAGIDRVTILSLYQSAVYNETKYQRLRLSCCNKLLTISQLPSSS